MENKKEKKKKTTTTPPPLPTTTTTSVTRLTCKKEEWSVSLRTSMQNCKSPVVRCRRAVQSDTCSFNVVIFNSRSSCTLASSSSFRRRMTSIRASHCATTVFSNSTQFPCDIQKKKKKKEKRWFEGSNNYVTQEAAVVKRYHCNNSLLVRSIINRCYEFVYFSYCIMLCKIIALLILLLAVLNPPCYHN